MLSVSTSHYESTYLFSPCQSLVEPFQSTMSNHQQPMSPSESVKHQQQISQPFINSQSELQTQPQLQAQSELQPHLQPQNQPQLQPQLQSQQQPEQQPQQQQQSQPQPQQQPQQQQPQPSSSGGSLAAFQPFRILDIDNALNELVGLLNDEDEVVVESALKVLYHVFRSSEHKGKALSKLPLIRSLIGLGVTSGDEFSIIKYVAAILNDISQTRIGLNILFNNNGLRVVYDLMQSNFELSNHYAILTLHNMLLKLDPAKIAVRKTGGIYYIVQLMIKSTHIKFLAIIADCLRLLAFGSSDGKELVLEYGGTRQLIQIFETNDYEKLLWNVARCIKVICVCPNNKQMIVDSGGIQILANKLNHKSKRLVMNILWAIRNMSDIASSQQDLKKLIDSLVHLLNNADDNIVSCTACILANLTCNNPFNKEIIYQVNAIPILIQILVKANEKKSIVEPVLMTIRHMTTRHKNSENCRELVCTNQGIQQVAKFLYTPFRWSTTKIAIELIRNLAISPITHLPFRELNVIERLVRLLSKSNEEIKRSSTIFKDLNNIMFEDIQVQQIIENILYTFQIFETDELNCEILIRHDFVSISFDLICYQTENIVKLAVSCLSFLVKIESVVKIMANEDAINVFRSLAVAQDKNLSENAKTILQSINEYRNKLQNHV